MIEVSHLTKRYGPRPAIQDLNFSVAKGEVVGFLGPNGAGKSTTMKILTGFMPATEGTAKVAGHDVFEEPIEVKRNVGYLPETPPVYLDMVVEDYVTFAAKLHGVESGKLASAVTSAIDRTGLGDVRGRLIGNLSKGYRQRVGLAQAIVHRPKVLILDEPTVGLDPRQIIEIRDLVRELAKETTVILSSHILGEISQTCTRVIIIRGGQIVAQDELTKLVATPRYAMQVKNPTNDGVKALESIKGVRSVSAAGSKIILEIDPQTEVRDTIIETAVSKKMGVLEFSTGQQTLEEVFLQLTSQ